MKMHLRANSIAWVVALVGGLVLSAGLCTNAHATLLPPGGSVVANPGLASGAATQVATTGAVAFQSQDFPVNPNGTSFTGTLNTRVWTNYPGNPFTGGTPGALT